MSCDLVNYVRLKERIRSDDISRCEPSLFYDDSLSLSPA